MDELTPDDVRAWDLSVIHQMFQAAKGLQGEHQKFGESLDNARARTNWHGQGGDAFREEIDKPRKDLDADGRESKAVAAAVQNAENNIRYCKVRLDDFDERARMNGWVITPDWRVDDSADTERTHDPQLLQNDVDQLKAKALAADHELAVAVRAAVGDTQVDAQGHEVPQANPPRDVGSQERPGVTDVNDPGVDWRPEFDPNKWKDSWRNPLLADNPPGYSGGPGPARDRAWQNYLAHYPNQKDPATGQLPRGYLPNPGAVNAPNLKVLGNAGQQLGTSYAWGGNGSTTGPSKGHGDGGGDATDYHDDNRVRFDCGGLVRYSVRPGHGNDPFINNGTSGAGTDTSLTPANT